MIRTTDNKALSTQTIENKKNQDAPNAAGGVDDGRVDRNIKNLSIVANSAKSKKSKSTKSKKLDLPKANFARDNSGTDFLTPETKKAFIYLRKAFTEAPILRHFDPECHFQIETNALGYAIGGVLSQMTSDQHYSGHITHKDPNSDFLKSEIVQWHPVAFFSQKMIPAETRYKTYNQKLLAIVKAFKTWRHYLEGYKYEVLVLTDHNNLCQFIDTKSLSSCQVHWTQELSRYQFRIDYCQEKANVVADTLSRFPSRSQAEEKTLKDENSQILYHLQTSLTRANIAGLSLLGHPTADFSLLHQVFICGTYVLPRFYQFWTQLRGELAQEGPYQQASVRSLRLRLSEL